MSASNVLQRLIGWLTPGVKSRRDTASTGPFSLDVRYQTGKGEAGLGVLASGWSAPEQGHVWSDGPSATLEIPFGDDIRKAPWLEIYLHGLIVPGPWTAFIRAASGPVMRHHRPEGGVRATTICLVIPRRVLRHAGEVLTLRLDFLNIYCPAERSGAPDNRRLSFGMQAFSLHTGLGARAVALLGDFVGQGRPARIIALSHDGDVSALKLIEALKRAGCGVASTIAHLADSQAAHPRWVITWWAPFRRLPKGRARKGVDLSAIIGTPHPAPHDKVLIILDGSDLLYPIARALQALSPEQLKGLAIYAMNAEAQAFYGLAAIDPRALDVMAGKVAEFDDIGCLIGAEHPTMASTIYMMAASRRGDHMVFHTAANCLGNSRIRSTADIIRDYSMPFAPDWRDGDRLWFQYDDFAHHDAPSLAYSRAREGFPQVQLVPDPYFISAKGYAKIRTRVQNGEATPWDARRDVVFWRGSPTTNFKHPSGDVIESLDRVPRIEMCLKLLHRKDCDVRIMAVWSDLRAALNLPDEVVFQYLTENNIYKPPVDMWEYSQCKFTIDIDGVSNAWSFFEKLLLGCCILKVGSPFEQWFYAQIKPWTHYVPVRDDLSDLEDKIDWCQRHPARAAEIARNGQAFALSHDYDAGFKVLSDEMTRNRLFHRSSTPTI